MRLTKEIEGRYLILHNWSERNTFEDQNKEELVIQKLGQLEDIEEELGIDLKIIGNLIANGIYISTSLNIEYLKGKHLCFDKNEKCIFAFISPHPIVLYFKDYGKTWALTKEELL